MKIITSNIHFGLGFITSWLAGRREERRGRTCMRASYNHHEHWTETVTISSDLNSKHTFSEFLLLFCFSQIDTDKQRAYKDFQRKDTFTLKKVHRESGACIASFVVNEVLSLLARCSCGLFTTIQEEGNLF